MSVFPYSLRNFRGLAERESRRGKDISRVVPATKDAVIALRELRETYKFNVSVMPLDSMERFAARELYREERQKLRESRDNILEESLHIALSQFQSSLNNRTFRWGLRLGPLIGDRQTFRVSTCLDITFPGKEAASILREKSGALMVGRNSIVRALRHSLMKRYTHGVYRIDIKSFFTTIPHKKLIDRIMEIRDLDQITVQLVKQLLSEYETLTGDPIGIPQGVGISSPLADLYLNDFDRAMRAFPGVLFYARYVDDIILVLEHEEARDRVAIRIDQLLSKLGLEVSKANEKFASIVSDAKGNYQHHEFIEYLGYKFTRSDDKLVTGLTDKRSSRRKHRLEAAFDHWLSKNPTRKTANTGDEGLLLDRVRFLAGNTSLRNSKDNVAVGIYFSNSSLDQDSQDLQDLDVLLQGLVKTNRTRMSPLLQARLRGTNFRASFLDRRFIRFNQKRLEQIVKCWREC